MRRGVLAMLLATASCSGMSFQPHAAERRGIDGIGFTDYTVSFEVACERCRVEYGRDGTTASVGVDGGWSGSVSLGTLRTGESAHVVLRAVPSREGRVLNARISIGERTLASSKGKKPGEAVNLSATIRAP